MLPCLAETLTRTFRRVTFPDSTALVSKRFDKLYAFTYDPPRAEKNVNGWQLYDARKEFKRMGISPKEADRGWRLSDINHDYIVRCQLP